MCGIRRQILPSVSLRVYDVCKGEVWGLVFLAIHRDTEVSVEFFELSIKDHLNEINGR